MLVSPGASVRAQRATRTIAADGPGRSANRSTRVDDPSCPHRRAATPQLEVWGGVSSHVILKQALSIQANHVRSTKAFLGRTDGNSNAKERLFMEIGLFDGSIKTSEAQYDYIMTSVGATAGRLKDAMCAFDIRLTDVNGPNGGPTSGVRSWDSPQGWARCAWKSRPQTTTRTSTSRWVVIPVCVAFWSATVPISIWTPVPSVVLWPAASILFTHVFPKAQQSKAISDSNAHELIAHGRLSLSRGDRDLQRGPKARVKS